MIAPPQERAPDRLPSLGRRLQSAMKPPPRRVPFWALKDVSFDVPQGDVLGIIGRNGAGKSTLLKVLSRITEPTSGTVDVYGRVASLLEVGTGFHPELTGRENVFLNGAILGMNRAEISRRFDEIVEFSGVEKFLETPVKRYSSGMYVRLAFAVAAHLDPDILIVDEVLAVGDMAFQKKCLGKMQDVADTGRTVILVSHNMNTITRLCKSAVLMEGGMVAMTGAADAVSARYVSGQSGSRAIKTWDDPSLAPGNEVVRARAVRVCNEFNDPCDTFEITRPVRISVQYDVLEAGHVLVPNFHLFNDEGVHLFNTGDNDKYWRYTPKSPGTYVSTVTIPGNLLAEGGVFVTGAMSTVVPFRLHYDLTEVVGFQIVDSLDSGGVRCDYAGHYPGVVRPWLKWQSEVLPDRVRVDSATVRDRVAAL